VLLMVMGEWGHVECGVCGGMRFGGQKGIVKSRI
jgi:hypothetical protein